MAIQIRRCGRIQLWVTKYKPNELYAGGEYPNQSKSEQGLPTLIADDEPLVGEDLVACIRSVLPTSPVLKTGPLCPFTMLVLS